MIIDTLQKVQEILNEVVKATNHRKNGTDMSGFRFVATWAQNKLSQEEKNR